MLTLAVCLRGSKDHSNTCMTRENVGGGGLYTVYMEMKSEEVLCHCADGPLPGVTDMMVEIEEKAKCHMVV